VFAHTKQHKTQHVRQHADPFLAQKGEQVLANVKVSKCLQMKKSERVQVNLCNIALAANPPTAKRYRQLRETERLRVHGKQKKWKQTDVTVERVLELFVALFQPIPEVLI
jgi:hypothetical protein